MRGDKKKKDDVIVLCETLLLAMSIQYANNRKRLKK